MPSFLRLRLGKGDSRLCLPAPVEALPLLAAPRFYLGARIQFFLAACRRILSFLRLRLGTRIGRLCLPAKLEAKLRNRQHRQ
jgi:hypothetical protein